jgi:hypothetical protein
MSHFVEINSENIVTNVIVAEQEYIDSGAVGDASNWVQTSYNTKGGIHYAPNSNTPDGGVALRKNYAGIGHTYDATRDAFYAPQPYPSWTLDNDKCQWEPPTARPDDDKWYSWDEDNTEWVEVSE